MRILTRYLIREVLAAFGMFVLLFVVISVINEAFDTRELILENAPDPIWVLVFLIYSIPPELGQMLPMLGLLGTMMAYGMLAKNREVLAMVAVGVSFRRVALPALGFGVALTGFTYWFGEQVVPMAAKEAEYIEKVKIGGRDDAIFTRRKNLFVKGAGNRFYGMQEYLSDQQEMVFPDIMELSDNGQTMERWIVAERARLVQDEQLDRFWEFTGAEVWTFAADGAPTYQRYEVPYQIRMEEDLDKFLSKTKDPEMMNFAELRQYRNLLRAKGGENLAEYSTSLHLKLAFPLTCLLMTLLGVSVTIDIHSRNFARGVVSGLLVAIGYYIVEAAMLNLGQGGVLPPVVAGWSPLLLFAIAVAVLLQRLETIRG